MCDCWCSQPQLPKIIAVCQTKWAFTAANINVPWKLPPCVQRECVPIDIWRKWELNHCEWFTASSTGCLRLSSIEIAWELVRLLGAFNWTRYCVLRKTLKLSHFRLINQNQIHSNEIYSVSLITFLCWSVHFSILFNSIITFNYNYTSKRAKRKETINDHTEWLTIYLSLGYSFWHDSPSHVLPSL